MAIYTKFCTYENIPLYGTGSDQILAAGTAGNEATVEACS